MGCAPAIQEQSYPASMGHLALQNLLSPVNVITAYDYVTVSVALSQFRKYYFASGLNELNIKYMVPLSAGLTSAFQIKLQVKNSGIRHKLI